MVNLSNSVCIVAPSGAGKSFILRGALEYYGSGLVLSAPGFDELDSYVGLDDPTRYAMAGFDDIDFDAAKKDGKGATGHDEAIKWLRARRLELEDDKANGRELRYKVLAVDTISALTRLGYNETLAYFRRDTPPPAQSPDGAAFYGHLRITLDKSSRAMRAIRGLGVHWLVASHPTEAQVTAIQAMGMSKEKIMPDIPGGFKNQFPSFFSTVGSILVGEKDKRYFQWGSDPKKVIKSRFGPLSSDGKIELPNKSKAAWEVIEKALANAKEKMIHG